MKEKFWIALTALYVVFGFALQIFPTLLLDPSGFPSFVLGVALLFAGAYFFTTPFFVIEGHLPAASVLFVGMSGLLFGAIATGIMDAPTDVTGWQRPALYLWASLVLFAAAVACHKIYQRVRNGLDAFA
jgi:hypothetical protein